MKQKFKKFILGAMLLLSFASLSCMETDPMCLSCFSSNITKCECGTFRCNDCKKMFDVHEDCSLCKPARKRWERMEDSMRELREWKKEEKARVEQQEKWKILGEKIKKDLEEASQRERETWGRDYAPPSSCSLTLDEALKILDINPDAYNSKITNEDKTQLIKRKYHSLALQIHPDKFGGSTPAFQRLSAARDYFLGDEGILK